MALNFPNPSRSYDASRHCVCFWGYDNAREIAFLVDDAVPEPRDGFQRTRCAGGLHVSVPTVTSATLECWTS